MAAVIVGAYLGLNAVVIGCGVAHILGRPELWDNWVRNVHAAPKVGTNLGTIGSVVLVALATFPQLALGLSGFELSMATAPLVRGKPDDSPEEPRGRIRRARLMMVVAAVIMSTFIAGSVFVVTLVVPVEAFGPGGAADHRALAWIAHGGNGTVSPLFGEAFGTLYDLSAVLILFLAGASATLSLRDLVPRYLAKYGMQLQWAAKVGVILHLFNVVILLVTLVFRADVQSQQSAYAASVLVLLTAASVAAFLDVRRRWRGSLWRPFAVVPFALIALFFLCMAVLTTILNSSGLVIALAFVATVFTTGFASRWMRSTELRFDGFVFEDELSKQRWEAIRELEFQVLVPHRTGHNTRAEKEAEIRTRHRIAADVPIIFIEAEVGDPSDFLHQPLMKIDCADDREIIRVSRCSSVAHVLAAIAPGIPPRRPPARADLWLVRGVAAGRELEFLADGSRQRAVDGA